MNRRDFDHVARILRGEYERHLSEGFDSAALGVKFAAHKLAMSWYHSPGFDFDRFMGHFKVPDAEG